MEIEKILYRVHERLLNDRITKRFIQICMMFFFIIGISSTLTLIMANFLYEGKSTCSKYMDFSVDENITSESYYQLTVEGSNLIMLVSSAKEFLSLNETIKRQHNFTQLNRTLPKTCYFHNSFSEFVFSYTIGYEDLLVNDIVSSYPIKFDLFVKNKETKEMWGWSKTTINKYRVKNSPQSKILVGVLQMFKIALGIFIQSAISSIYIRIIILCSPIFILLIMEAFVNLGNRQIEPIHIYRAFPWIGVYLQVLDQNNPRSKSHLLLAFCLFLLLFYFIYLSTVFIGAFILFYKSIPNRLDENFFGFMAIVEFCALLFFRTRATIYYAPKFILLIYFFFFVYVQYSAYGFFYLAFYCVIYWIIFFICWFIYYLEIPALSWNSQSYYTPTLERPRCYYFPLFHFIWMNDIPHIWTLFYPLHGRRFFNQNSLALVDQNFLLLNNILRQDQNQDAEIIEIQNPEQNQNPQPILQVAQPEQNQQPNQIENTVQFNQFQDPESNHLKNDE